MSVFITYFKIQNASRIESVLNYQNIPRLESFRVIFLRQCRATNDKSRCHFRGRAALTVHMQVLN